MILDLKEFQSEAVADLRKNFAVAQNLASSTPAAMLLNAPTGSGKTLIITTLIDQLLAGSDDAEGDPGLTFVWLTDQPELNKQTYDKIVSTSRVLTPSDLVIIDARLNVEELRAGKVYFLNTQKLGTGTSFVKRGDNRDFTLWETIEATVVRAPTRCVLVIDEAHRGARGKDATEAETIMQKFMKGGKEISAVPLVLGISATPDRFVKLCNDTNRPLFRIEVDPVLVRESGLLKEFVDLYHPDEDQPSRATMLREAISAWKKYGVEWSAYGKQETQEAIPSPVLLVQVEDTKAGSASPSKTDLNMVVDTILKEISHDDNSSWIAHAFQEEADLMLAGQVVRHIAPSDIDRDPSVKVVLFKTSLNTGWDCPRAETMVSFRAAKDETNIAQLVGRMVRAPLARRIESNEYLNSVALYLPYYDRKAVEKVVKRLTSDPSAVPPTEVRLGSDVESLIPARERSDCIAVLATLPTYIIPSARPMKPVARLAKLAGLLAELSLLPDPVKTYRRRLVKVLLEERTRLARSTDFKNRVRETSILEYRRRRLNYATVSDEDLDHLPAELMLEAEIAERDVEGLYAEAGRLLGEGLHREYLRERRKNPESESQGFKLELHALVSSPGVLAKVSAAAESLRKKWTDAHKAVMRNADERHRIAFREISGAGSTPELSSITPPIKIEGSKKGDSWEKHLYVDSLGEYHQDFKSSWERKVIEREIARDSTVGWLRNEDRKPWSLCIKRLEGTKWIGIYPDFIVFRRTSSGILADIVDPHLLSDEHAPARAVALAKYASDHGDSYGRIELVIYESEKDTTGKRLNLMNEAMRNRVASVTSHEYLRYLFETTENTETDALDM